MKKKTIKEFCGMNNVTEYIESLGEETTIISHTIQGEWHYIITEREEVQQPKEEKLYMKCIHRAPLDFGFTTGNKYEVLKDKNGYFILDDINIVAITPQDTINDLENRLNERYASQFRLIQIFKQNA